MRSTLLLAVLDEPADGGRNAEAARYQAVGFGAELDGQNFSTSRPARSREGVQEQSGHLILKMALLMASLRSLTRPSNNSSISNAVRSFTAITDEKFTLEVSESGCVL